MTTLVVGVILITTMITMIITIIILRSNYTGAMTTLVVGVILITAIVVIIAMHKRGKLEDLL